MSEWHFCRGIESCRCRSIKHLLCQICAAYTQSSSDKAKNMRVRSVRAYDHQIWFQPAECLLYVVIPVPEQFPQDAFEAKLSAYRMDNTPSFPQAREFIKAFVVNGTSRQPALQNRHKIEAIFFDNGTAIRNPHVADPMAGLCQRTCELQSTVDLAHH